MRTKLKIVCRVLIRRALMTFFIFPVKRNRIVMSSYHSARDYTCNPKYITEYLKRHESGKYELVWAFADPERWKGIKGVRSIKIHSLTWLYYMLTAKVIVYNRNPETYLPKRKGQLVINTWHAGGAYKKVGFENALLAPLDRWKAEQFEEYVDLFVSSSEAFTKSNIESYHYRGRVLKSGMPRNDFFFRPKAVAKVSARVRRKYGADGDSFVVLYAPTYRGDVLNPAERKTEFPYQAVREVLTKRLRMKTGGSESTSPRRDVLREISGSGKDSPCPDVRIWRREHHEDTNVYENAEGVTDVSGEPDMQDLLAAADLLITDYSSSIWDFAILRRPSFLFCPDLADYESSDRGFFTPIGEWPGYLVRSEEELLKRLLSYDAAEAEKKAEDHLRALKSYEDGRASRRIAAIIDDWTANH